MSDPDVEQRIKRQREILRALDNRFQVILANGDGLEHKAWNILSTGSTIFAAVAILQTAIAREAAVPQRFWVGLIVVLALYLLMAACAVAAIWPRGHAFPFLTLDAPGSWNEWEAEFITSDEADFLQAQIINLTGNGEIDGVIGDNEALNARCARLVTLSSLLMTATVAGLVALAVLMV